MNLSSKTKNCEACAEAFHYDIRHSHQKYCSKRCAARIWGRANRINNRDSVRAYVRSYLQVKREFINRAKSKPCLDCHIQYNPWQMQFDHRDPAKKKFGIGSGTVNSIAALQAEIDKCDVVCANCHMERTHKQLLARDNRAYNAL